MIKKILAIILAVIVLALGFIQVRPLIGGPDVENNEEAWKTNYRYVFVHGLSGWGSYDAQNIVFPYWGTFGGDSTRYLNHHGFDCYAASVAPTDSAWDRACELYAQLTGTRVDYGRAHSEKMGHERYGEDFTGDPLVPSWNETDKINLLGHSFGGATVRTFISLLDKGSNEEKAVTDASEISGFFTGGKAAWVHSVVTLAAPHNGTSAYSMDDGKVVGAKEETGTSKAISKLMSLATGAKKGDRDETDYASYDMYIDNALELNKNLSLPENIYYFSIPCTATVKNSDGTYSPDESLMEGLYQTSAEKMGHFTGTTKGGFEIDESWQENDGLVNTISATYPFGQPHVDYDRNNVVKGTWNVMPTYTGDHMSLQGGMFKRNDMRGNYVELFNMINSLDK